MSTYSEKLKDPRWQKKRLEMLEKNEWECEVCGSKAKTLHVHHRTYRQGILPWEYEDNYYMVLCECCHDMFHKFCQKLSNVGNGVPADCLSAFLAGDPNAPAWILSEFSKHLYNMFLVACNKNNEKNNG